jgi:hypothetical protein
MNTQTYHAHARAAAACLATRDRLSLELALYGDAAFSGLIVALMAAGIDDKQAIIDEASRLADFDCEGIVIDTLSRHSGPAGGAFLWHKARNGTYRPNVRLDA